jgi:hypothetical protein
VAEGVVHRWAALWRPHLDDLALLEHPAHDPFLLPEQKWKEKINLISQAETFHKFATIMPVCSK